MSERSMRESLMIQLFLALVEDRPRRRPAGSRVGVQVRRPLTPIRRPRRVRPSV